MSHDDPTDATLDAERRELDALIGWQSTEVEVPEHVAEQDLDELVDRLRSLPAEAEPPAPETQADHLEPADNVVRLRAWWIPRLNAAAGVLLFLAVGATGLLWYQNKEQEEQKSAALQAEAERARAEAEKKQRELEAKQAEIRELQEAIAVASDPAEIEALKKKLEAAQRDAKDARPAGAGTPRAKPAACAPGDPLCSDL